MNILKDAHLKEFILILPIEELLKIMFAYRKYLPHRNYDQCIIDLKLIFEILKSSVIIGILYILQYIKIWFINSNYQLIMVIFEVYNNF